MDPLPNPAPLASKLRNTLVRYNSIADGEWRAAKKTVSAPGGFPPPSPREEPAVPCHTAKERSAGLQTDRRCKTIPLERL